MSNPEPSRTPTNGLTEIEAEIAKHRAELAHTVTELSERFNLKKRAKGQWNHTKRSIENSAAVAKDNLDLALVRAEFALPRHGATLITAALGVLACILVTVVVRRRKP